MNGLTKLWRYCSRGCIWSYPIASSQDGCFSTSANRITNDSPHHDSKEKDTATSTLLSDEERKFSAISHEWWDLNGSLRTLHSMNEVRIPFIRDCLLYEGYGDGRNHTATPLEGLDILDVGCGGGILSEPLARLGADVLGIDASEPAISAAKRHREPDCENLQYLCATIEDIASVGSLKFDAVIASEIIEHVADQKSFVHSCASLLKPRGSLFFSTINRTLLSKILAVNMAELFGIVPKGAHDWERFVTRDELEKHLLSAHCEIRKTHGMMYNPITDRWSFIGDQSINYIVHATREVESKR